MSLFITAVCLVPILFVFGGWVFPLADASRENWDHIRSTVLSTYIAGSLIVITGVALVAGSIGGVTAWFVARFNFPLRGYLSWMLVLPFAMPSFVLAMTYGQIFEFAGPVQSFLREVFDWQRDDYIFPQIRSIYGVIFLLGLANFPYVYLISRAAFEAQSSEWAQLSDVFGKAGRYQLFWLSLGAARPFLALGVALAIIEAAADIGVTQLFGVQTLATGLYRLWYFGNDPVVSARLASILVCIAAVLLMLERLTRKRANFHTSGSKNPIPRKNLQGLQAWIVTVLLGLPVLLGFLLPLFWTARLAIFNNRFVRFERIYDATIDSLYLCIVGGLVTVVSAFIVNASERDQEKYKFQWIASLGYAVPGIVIALSLLLAQSLLQTHFGWRLAMTGSVLGLIIAYLVRFFAPAYQNLHAGFLRISPEIDMMARSFGKTRLAIILQIFIPLMRAPVFYAGLLVAIDIFKELPASLILRPFDISTLSIVVFEFSGDDRPAEAAPYALILIAIALVGVYLLNKLHEDVND